MEKTKRLLSGELIGNAMSVRAKKIAGQSNSPEGTGLASTSRPVVTQVTGGASGSACFNGDHTRTEGID